MGCCRSGIRNASFFEQQHSGTEGTHGCRRSQDKWLIAAPSRNTETLLNIFTLGGMFVSWNLIYSPFLSSASLLFLLRIQTAVLSFLAVPIGPMY